MEYDSYILYLQKNNGYWEKEPYSTLEEINEALETIFDDEYWWYLVIGKSRLKGDTTICGGKVHTKQEYKTRKKGR